MAENIEARFEYLKEKFPKIEEVRFTPRPTGYTMHLKVSGRSELREETFQGVSMSALMQLAKNVWPDAFRSGGDDEVQICINKEPRSWYENMDAAQNTIRQLELSLDEILTVKDTRGQTIARYVSNRSGQIRKLED